MTRLFGLIGTPLAQSFSRRYFLEKFEREHIDADYRLFELKSLEELDGVLRLEGLEGLNVTIPYKERVMDRLDELDDTARAIGAVNVIRIRHSGGRMRLRGYNSDCIGFMDSIRPHLQPGMRHALVLGTGGASKAVAYGLRQLGLDVMLASRTRRSGAVTYEQLNRQPAMMHDFDVIVNATPLGMFPQVDTCPDLPYEAIGPRHLLFDVVYNPEKTLFLQHGEACGALTVGGGGMLVGQAQAAWKIWNT